MYHLRMAALSEQDPLVMQARQQGFEDPLRWSGAVEEELSAVMDQARRTFEGFHLNKDERDAFGSLTGDLQAALIPTLERFQEGLEDTQLAAYTNHPLARALVGTLGRYPSNSPTAPVYTFGKTPPV